jgi:hypothetical protein
MMRPAHRVGQGAHEGSVHLHACLGMLGMLVEGVKPHRDHIHTATHPPGPPRMHMQVQDVLQKKSIAHSDEVRIRPRVSLGGSHGSFVLSPMHRLVI